MFQQNLASSQNFVKIDFEGNLCEVPENISVAAAIQYLGINNTKNTFADEQRAPYCHMGICFECLMEIDGVANQQACLIPVREGLQVRRQLTIPTFTARKEG